MAKYSKILERRSKDMVHFLASPKPHIFKDDGSGMYDVLLSSRIQSNFYAWRFVKRLNKGLENA